MNGGTSLTFNTRLACPIANFTGADGYPRKKVRTMGAVARMATYATERALIAAGLIGDPVLCSGRTGIAYGSSFGSPQPYVAFAELMTRGTSRKLNATSYIQNDEPYSRGEYRAVLRRGRQDNSDIERLHFRQSGNRLRVRNHPMGTCRRDARGRG